MTITEKHNCMVDVIVTKILRNRLFDDYDKYCKCYLYLFECLNMWEFRCNN